VFDRLDVSGVMPTKPAGLARVYVRGHGPGPGRPVDRRQAPVQCFFNIAKSVPATLMRVAIKACAARDGAELGPYNTGMSRQVVCVARHLAGLRQAPGYQLALRGIAANNNSVHNILSNKIPYYPTGVHGSNTFFS
tara:strand:+ start:2099 stop:2506 length:408 start_codon:yes stop_codon:yes gene_type:complete